jgi:hypothetical protein
MSGLSIGPTACEQTASPRSMLSGQGRIPPEYCSCWMLRMMCASAVTDMMADQRPNIWVSALYGARRAVPGKSFFSQRPMIRTKQSPCLGSMKVGVKESVGYFSCGSVVSSESHSSIAFFGAKYSIVS